MKCTGNLFYSAIIGYNGYGLSDNTAGTIWRTIANIACGDAYTWVTCMNHSSTTDTNGYMIDMTIFGIEN